MNKSPGRGRRAGQPDTRESIRLAARTRFLADGYDQVTMRTIAADAQVDVALISYYFGSKRGLFGAAMSLPVNPVEVFGQVIATGVDGLPERALRSLLTVWDAPETGEPLRAVAALAATDPDIGRLVREGIGAEVVDRLVAELNVPDGPARAATFTTHMAGLIYGRYVLRLEPLASMSPDEVVDRLVPALQLALDGG